MSRRPSGLSFYLPSTPLEIPQFVFGIKRTCAAELQNPAKIRGKKIFDNIVDVFLDRSNCFPCSPKALKKACFEKKANFCKKNRPKKAFLALWKILTKNCVFSARAPPKSFYKF